MDVAVVDDTGWGWRVEVVGSPRACGMRQTASGLKEAKGKGAADTCQASCPLKTHKGVRLVAAGLWSGLEPRLYGGWIRSN